MENYNKKFIKTAYELALQVKGLTCENPAVGAVIVKNQKIISKGATSRTGRPHAEVNAIENCKEDMRNSTMYVTLEPCSYFGKTPPCTQAIIKAGIKKVVIGTVDPNPEISGSGIKQLNEAGIETSIGFMHNELAELNESFFKRVRTGLPFVSIKFAQTLDGRIAAHTGDSKWITSSESRKYVHYLRGINQAILVGTGTIIKDNPKLTVRECDLPSPLRIIPDALGIIPDNFNVICDENASLFFVNRKTPESFIKNIEKRKNKRVILHNGDGDVIPISFILSELGKLKINGIFVEGGSKILSAFLEQDYVDKVYAFIAPLILGSGLNSINLPLKDSISSAIKLKRINQKRFSDDVLLTGYIREPEEYLKV